MAEQEIEARAFGGASTVLDADHAHADNPGLADVMEWSAELDASSDQVESHEDQTPFLISTPSAYQPAVCHHNCSVWRLVLIVIVFCTRWFKARTACGGAQCRSTGGEQGGHDSLCPFSHDESQHLRLLEPSQLDETTSSATSLLLQSITRLEEEIKQRNCKVILLSYIIAKLRAEEIERKGGVEESINHTSQLVQEQLLKVKEQVVHLSEIVKECKSLCRYITENTVEFLELEKALAQSNCRARSPCSSSTSSSTALKLAETILNYSLRKISRLEELMRKRGEEVMQVKEEEKKQREKDLRKDYEDQVKILESRIQKVLHEKEAIVREANSYYKEAHAKQINSHNYQTARAFQQQQQALDEARNAINALRVHHEAEMAALKERVRYHDERYQEAHSRMQKAEQLLADHSIVDSAFYRDDSATPTLLQAAADGVKGAISMCASNIFKFTHDHSGLLNINIQYLHNGLGQHQLDVNGKNRKVVVKMALQAFLCELLFHGFESPAYSLSSQSSGMAFEKPEIRRKQRFQTFKRLRYLEPVQMLEQDHKFNSFLTEKAAFVGKGIRNLLQIVYNGDESTTQAQAAAYEQLIGCELLGGSPSSPFFKSFLRLAKAAWLLHKLAFACEPASAEIFRVAPNSVFLGDYMEEHEDTRSMAPHSGDDDDRKLVTLMNVPGFTVRNSVIRSVVCRMH